MLNLIVADSTGYIYDLEEFGEFTDELNEKIELITDYFYWYFDNRFIETDVDLDITLNFYDDDDFNRFLDFERFVLIPKSNYIEELYNDLSEEVPIVDIFDGIFYDKFKVTVNLSDNTLLYPDLEINKSMTYT